MIAESSPMPKNQIKLYVKNMITEYEGMKIDPKIGSYIVIFIKTKLKN